MYRRVASQCQLACLLACLLPSSYDERIAPPSETPKSAEVPPLVAPNLVVDGVPSVPESILAGLDRYRNTRSASLLGWIGDGILIATRFGNTTQLHRVDDASRHAPPDHLLPRTRGGRIGQPGRRAGTASST